MRQILKAALSTLIGLGAVAGTGHAAPDADVGRRLEQRADRFFADAGPGGVVLVRRGEEVLLRKAYGLADVEHAVAMTPDAVFRMASVTKQFTAVAILQLVQAGRLKLDQALASIDPSLPPALGAVTIRQLLTHTSGVTNISRIEASRAARRNEADPQQLIAWFKDLPLEFEPGTQFAYSNSNYILLTAVIERITGRRYADHMQSAVFTPAGMRDTRYGSHLAIVPRRAAGYQQGEHGLLNADFIDMSQPQGAGGLLTTADDLAHWDAALYGDALVDQAQLAEAFRKVRLRDGSEPPYGFGWMLADVQGLPSQEHGGAINGFNSQLLRVPGQRVFVTVLTNAEFLVPDALAVELAAIAAGRPYDFTAGDASNATAWLGTYRFDDGAQRTVLQRDGQVYSQRDGSDPIALAPTADGRWYFEQSLNYVSFAHDGDAASMTIHDRLLGDSTGVRGPAAVAGE